MIRGVSNSALKAIRIASACIQYCQVNIYVLDFNVNFKNSINKCCCYVPLRLKKKSEMQGQGTVGVLYIKHLEPSDQGLYRSD
jgi:hypothetical protein